MSEHLARVTLAMLKPKLLWWMDADDDGTTRDMNVETTIDDGDNDRRGDNDLDDGANDDR